MSHPETDALYMAWASLLKDPARAVVGAAKTMTESFLSLDFEGRSKHKDAYFGVLAELYSQHLAPAQRVACPTWGRIEGALTWFTANPFQANVFDGFRAVQETFWRELAP